MLSVAKSRNHALNYQFGAGETMLISDRINSMELGKKITSVSELMCWNGWGRGSAAVDLHGLSSF